MHPQKILHKTKADTWKLYNVTFGTHLLFESSTYSYKIRRPFLRYTKLGHMATRLQRLLRL